MKEIPILFSTDMVQQLLAGTKTQTRRVIKPQPIDNTLVDGNFFEGNHKGYVKVDGHPYWKQQFAHGFSRWQQGDFLWVRETWSPKYVKGCLDEYQLVYPDKYPWTYLADDPAAKAYGYGNPWKPSIHMPKAAARIWLEVTNVKVERLQDISDHEAVAEGIESYIYSGRTSYVAYKDYLNRKPESESDILGPVGSYRSLWELINGKDSWAVNPWVWVISFKVLSTKGKPEAIV